MKNTRRLMMLVFTVLMAVGSTALAADPAAGQDELAAQVRKALVMQPYYGVFDSLGYRIEGSTVTLVGHAVRPTLKSSAEKVVSRLPGVQNVVNEIKVLPVSPYDDRLRLSIYWAIYGSEAFTRHANRAQPPIHIIVENGKVKLVGFVANPMERTLAQIRASQTPGVFAVVNDLKIDS